MPRVRGGGGRWWWKHFAKHFMPGALWEGQGQGQGQRAPKKLTAYLTRHIQALKSKIKRQGREAVEKSALKGRYSWVEFLQAAGERRCKMYSYVSYV